MWAISLKKALARIRAGPDSVAAMTYEDLLPWEQAQGSTIERTIKVSAEAQKVYAQQEQILPALNHDHSIDPVITEHLHDVGRRVLILRESTKGPSKREQKILEKNAPKRVIPSRYEEEDDDDDYSDDATEDPAVLDGRITTPVLMNKAFRNLSKLTNKVKVFRVACLLAILSEWFTLILSVENAEKAFAACFGKLTYARESCNTTGVASFSSEKKNYDSSVCARLRAMHMVKHLELRHQFKILREAIGSGGLPADVVGAYVTILYHLARKKGSAQSEKAHNNMIADQKKIVGSGALVFLASLISKTQKREIVEMAKEIVFEIATSQGDDKIIDILVCNIVDRVVEELKHLMEQKIESTHPAFMSSVNLLAVLSEIVLASKRRYENSSPSKSTSKAVTGTMNLAAKEAAAQKTYLLKTLEECAKTYFITASCVQTLFSALRYDRRNDALCIKILETLRLLAGSFGFTLILDALTRNGGRSIELVISHFDHQESSVVLSAVSMFYELTNHPDARKGLTTAGATQLFIRWCDTDIETTKSPLLHVLGLIGMALLARQTNQVTSSARLLSSLATLSDRLDVAYDLLLDLVWDDNKNFRLAEKAAMYLLSVRALPALLQFFIRVKPSCMNSPFQSVRQRNISCIVLSRFLKVAEVAQACFSEALVNHLALSLQCNRLDEIEHLAARMSAQNRYIHRLGSKEACKALSRLARCPSASVDAKLTPSITSATVPELPQALICDVMFRLHALEDLIAHIKCPSDGAEFVDLELDSIMAAIELAGYLRPLPFGEVARDKFLKAFESHAYGKYAREKLISLVELVAPIMLHVLREKNLCPHLVNTCCTALSRLACTNAACSLLLSQGCLHIAILHVPEVLLVSSDPGTKHQSFEYDSSVDDHGLLDIPSSLFTLVGKLCAVAEGRTAVMRAQVLPRILKRLQLRNTALQSVDEECKSEVAVVIHQLAMLNTVEGNTSELFLHFHVLELLMQLARDQDIPMLFQGKGKSQKWRLLGHVLGGIAALSQDVLVCVPKVAEMGVLQLIMPFILRNRKDEAAARLESLQYHAVSIVRSVASYPFGKYHKLLQSIEEKHSLASSKGIPTALLERVKKVAYNFALELENRPASSMDKKTVGELARETLSFMHDLAQQQNATKSGTSSRNSALLEPVSSENQAQTRKRSTLFVVTAKGISTKYSYQNGFA
uniref:Uncharacterized protein n=1 Tax=Globisporangium ultimum (strain ATCC 200006 / CBS 805.95 / DAOM BR144) TaxID=431595 RepID=K3WGT0_GLOUD